MRDERDFLDDILINIQDIQGFVQPGYNEFLENKMMQQAVLRCLEIIGEASRNLSEELRQKHPEVLWRKIIGFRNFSIHAYWAIKLERIWEIIRDDLPVLKTQIEAILQELDEPPQPPTEA